jgi:hypothetical protein
VRVFYHDEFYTYKQDCLVVGSKFVCAFLQIRCAFTAFGLALLRTPTAVRDVVDDGPVESRSADTALSAGEEFGYLDQVTYSQTIALPAQPVL